MFFDPGKPRVQGATKLSHSKARARRLLPLLSLARAQLSMEAPCSNTRRAAENATMEFAQLSGLLISARLSTACPPPCRRSRLQPFIFQSIRSGNRSQPGPFLRVEMPVGEGDGDRI
ncbi:MAG: hypothetical protein H6Q04_3395, partial [Acidobacteria bacterium]|nr:hypothetical protein [Acidobacteriota bacterium]